MVTWPRPALGTNRGVHWSASTNHSPALSSWGYWARELQAMGIGWVKLLDDSRGSSLTMCQALLSTGIVPIVRLYRARPNPGTLDSDAQRTVSRLVACGVRYVECNNEPNLPLEWQDGQWQSGGRPELVMDHWVQDARMLLDLGALPAFPALAQCALHGEYSSIEWYKRAFAHLYSAHRSTARDLFASGAWLAVHDAALNHFYQDGTGQWHFEYPYDRICQADDPGRSILEDDCSLIGHRVPVQLLKERFGLEVPVLSTEGGVFVPRHGSQSWDSRYPPVTYPRHAEATVAMFDWLARNEKGVWAMCPWLVANEYLGHDNPAWTEDAWYHKDGIRPVVAAMKASNVPQVSEAQVREAAWNRLGRAFNPGAAFQKHAAVQDLGFPVTGEFDLGGYRIQGYAQGIVYCRIGDWANVRSIPWSEKGLAAASGGGLWQRIRQALGR